MTQEKQQKRHASLNPQYFSTGERFQDKSLEEIINQFKELERHRNPENEDVSERPEPMYYSSVPEGLILGLESVSKVSVKRHILTRCQCHQFTPWLELLPEVLDLFPEYEQFMQDVDGYPDLHRRLLASDFRFIRTVPASTNSGRSSFHSIHGINSRITELSSVAGASPSSLFCIGLSWSITTNESSWADGTIAKYLLPEVRRFLHHLRERKLTIRYFNALIQLRKKE